MNREKNKTHKDEVVKMISLTQAINMWNEKLKDYDCRCININSARRNKEKTFHICSKGSGEVDVYFDVGFTILKNRCYVDNNKFASAINKAKEIACSDIYKEGKKESYNLSYESARHGSTNEFFQKD
ncbi:MAG: hypothetical protein Hyperionvirus10_29 [Hyperionvirus sp.]|uniref:Uncharacterized protein n=1 Tax=Hyperionvirus sp. TaxID=2487770 RepID=A0A3G5ACT0_9VIRU|nr:MAG: hypothetical protein Hyperionvirus10_29 [Hyperionvirus sp.]